MELAVNTFTKGLQLDTNPMILGNDSLTDCLNGTIVTMNGNEMILLNDMGNRRVDNAFLPSGYQPVGMKEYGGIIYVAAYNPITNKSLIGSFPSPQKRINSLNTSGMGGVFDFSKFFYNSNITLDSDLFNIKVINSDSFMIPLTKDVSLRAGDKFVIYSNDIENLKNNISNYDNTISDENGVKYIKSPKNKKYTLQLGILNSQNEFVDITKTLCRWELKDNKSVPKIYDLSYSDLYKFNDGYFIALSFDNDNLEYTENDAKLIINRQTLPANTYSYKLIGPLYLKVILNHIQNFNYNIYGYKEGNNTILTIEGFITYNCPDGVDFKKNPVGEYYTLDEGEVNFLSFDLYNSDGYIPEENLEQKECEYLPELNQYRVKIVKNYEIGLTEGIFNYVIGVNADTTQNNNIYIKELSSKGSLNLDLLGTGTLQYNGWKFYNNQEETTLTFSFEAYPKYGESFEDLWFEFIDITKPQSNNPNNPRFPLDKDSYLPVYNGRLTYTFDWNIIGLEPRKVYKVITHYKSGNNNNFNDKSIDDNRWLLTTSLFNEFYPSSAGISDFSIARNLEFLDKMKIYLKVEDNLRTDFPEETSFNGSLVGQNKTISYSCKHTVGINIVSNPTLKIVDEELYPDFITIKDSYKDDVKITNPTIKIGNKPTDKNNIIKDFKELLSVIKNGSIDQILQEFNTSTVIEYEDLNVDSNIITGELSYYDIYKSVGEAGFEVNNVFGDVLNLIDDAYKIDLYGGILVNKNESSGHRDGHFIDVYVNVPESKRVIIMPSNDDLDDDAHRVFSLLSDSHITINFKDIYPQIFDVFNLTTDKSQMFLYFFPAGNTYNNDRDSVDAAKILSSFFNNNLYNPNDVYAVGSNYALLWWRTSDNSWALFKNMINIKTIKNSIINNFNPSGVLKHYCMYNDYQIDEGFYAATNNNMYYDEYSIPLSILINYSIQGNILDIISITENIKFGNLIFEALSEIKDCNLVSLKLTSSETFNNNILSFNRSSIYSMDLGTGLMLDSLGRNLDPNYIYKYDAEKKQLIRINNTYMLVDFDHKINNKNTLVYNRSTPGIPMFRFQLIGSGSENHDHTTLDYELANIVLGI